MNAETEIDANALKECPRCSAILPISRFGICRARKDGRNMYCKKCIREKSSASRRALRERRQRYREALLRQQLASSLGKRLPSGSPQQDGETARHYPGGVSGALTPVERVLHAIKKGARTQQDIISETGMAHDEIGEALANLLLWKREVVSKTIGDTRIYLPKDEQAEPAARVTISHGRLSEFDPFAETSFSALHMLMPGKQSDGEAKRHVAWVAM